MIFMFYYTTKYKEIQSDKININCKNLLYPTEIFAKSFWQWWFMYIFIVSFIIVGAKVLYRLHPDQQDKAVALVTTLPSQPSKEALKVRPHLLVITLTTCFR